jgi:catechol 2,3-dioxygenase-like lactoylglutathione lyase family enzyme
VELGAQRLRALRDVERRLLRPKKISRSNRHPACAERFPSAMPLDHIDLRVPDLEAAKPFYGWLLPELGFAREVKIDGWFQFETEDGHQFFGITEDREHRPNRNRVAFKADSNHRVDQLAEFVRSIGAMNIEGPLWEDEGCYAVFFEDPFGNRLEIAHRAR